MSKIFPMSAVLALLAGAHPGAAAEAWHDTPITRLEALALIEQLNAELLSASSATLTLEHWCQAHDLAAPAQIVARKIEGAAPAASPGIRQDLQVSADEALQYRRVELRCGEHTLSIAENWYVPARLTPEMNGLLSSTQTPFGKVVRALSPHRETLAVTRLWSPLEAGWEHAPRRIIPRHASPRRLEMPSALFEHRALLYIGSHQPIAEVREIYQRDVLAFPEPRLIRPN